MLAIIGGTGFEDSSEFVKLQELDRETPFGLCSSGLCKVKVNQVECLFLSRHGAKHELLPSEVNCAANIYALKKHGAEAVLSFSAVGSLKQEYRPGDLVVPFQYMDRTKSLRRTTFLGGGVVGHVSLAKPVCKKMVSELKTLTSRFAFQSHFGATYVCVEGPYFSTQAESNSYRQMGATIIGMTHFPEYGLAREAGLPYLPCCWITDYDCWDDSIPHVTVAEVGRTMKDNNTKAFTLLKNVVTLGPHLWEGSLAPESGIRNSLMTAIDDVPADKLHWLKLLTK